MDEFTIGWCRHHFSFHGTNSSVPVPAYSAQQDSRLSPPGWSPAEIPFHPGPHPFLTPAPPVQIFSTTYADQPPSEPSSDSDDSVPAPTPDDEASVPAPGPVKEAPLDREARAGYLRLLLATETHRRELRRRRRAEQAPPPLQLSADTERLRQRQMRELYGAAAERVAAAESRAQLEFDTITDQRRPPLWPNIPLRMRFA